MTTTAVAVGGGGPTPVVMAFTPQSVTINAGQTVVWTNPTVVPEPHTVYSKLYDKVNSSKQSCYLKRTEILVSGSRHHMPRMLRSFLHIRLFVSPLQKTIIPLQPSTAPFIGIQQQQQQQQLLLLLLLLL